MKVFEEEEKGAKIEERAAIGQQQRSYAENAMPSEKFSPHTSPKAESAYLKPEAAE